ncbi:terminase [Vibrio phage PS25B.1]|nr:terminase [Vibrio phage PS25B.1]
MSDIDVRLAEEISYFYDKPYEFVLYAFPWGEPGTSLHGFDAPDEWQKELLIALGDEVKERGFNGVDAVDPIQVAVSSGHGIGKSAFTAMVILWIMSTRPKCKGVVTANTGEQLKTKTMSELSKWHSLCITGHWFEMNTMSISHRAYPKSWRCDALTSREEASEGFAGLHAADSTPFYIFDEASAIPEKIWEVAKGGLTDGEPMHICFGNPTRNNGSFYECFRKNSHRWITRQIDSRKAKMTNKRLIQTWIDDFGEDSDFVRVRVRGMFPKGGDMQFIPSDVVYDAMRRGSGIYLGDDPLICGIDMARGGDDNCMIQFRRGKDAKSEKVYKIPGEKSRDSMKVVSLLTMILDRHKPDVAFMDKGSMGGPVADRLRQLGYHVIDVGFGDNAADVKHFKMRTAEMGSRCRQWLLDGGAIPNDSQLELELTAREFGHNDKDQLVLERKKDMKKRIGVSPDWADALYLTFAEPVPKREVPRGHLDHNPYVRNNERGDYNPLSSLDNDDYT